MACGPSQLYEPVKVRYPFQEPGNDDAEAVSDRDPDYRIDERNPIEILQEYMGINNMGQIPGDFFKEHDTEGHAAQEYERFPYAFRNFVA